MKTAKAWGLTPRQWREQTPDDQALMLAFELFEGTRQNYGDEYREAWHKKHGKDKDEGNREFKAMQREKALERRGYL